ncbi:MAG: hypothetical protein IJS39_13450 [Synergistaceae bacterium]|nr:hypothetical protein [Synergistaceae bacterium]
MESTAVRHKPKDRIRFSFSQLPFQLSENTLTMMDKSMDNFIVGNVSAVINLSEFQD